jgi:XTP/dITP diphosphohydrolase
VLALVDPYSPDGEIALTEGVCEGSITSSARGSFGFGYDPLFLVAGQDKTMAELSEAEKNSLSHRARACHALRPLLRQILADREAMIGRLEQAASGR